MFFIINLDYKKVRVENYAIPTSDPQNRRSTSELHPVIGFISLLHLFMREAHKALKFRLTHVSRAHAHRFHL